ncbi:MAG: hypothetical protein SFU25_04665, partial [Candidatus Caenarcaniphilales bacterium]|nr:hypothetical protein [Candidatus Caenarcaniphilales bacterium]
AEHYELLKESVKYEMVDGFDNKLGWKMANLFGRVGTEDYSQMQVESLVEKFFPEINRVIKATEISDELYDMVKDYKKKPHSAKLNKILEEISSINL